MKLGRLVLGTAVAMTLAAGVQAEELKLTEQQLDQVTAAGPIGDNARSIFAGLALGAFVGGLGGGPVSTGANGLVILREYVKLEILIAQNGW